jgi:hypothetical protein
MQARLSQSLTSCVKLLTSLLSCELMYSFLLAMTCSNSRSLAWSALSSAISSSMDEELDSAPVAAVSLAKIKLKCRGGSRHDCTISLVLTAASAFGTDSNLSNEGGDVCCLKETVKPDGVLMALPSMALMLTVRT